MSNPLRYSQSGPIALLAHIVWPIQCLHICASKLAHLHSRCHCFRWMSESQLLRAGGTLAVAADIRNPADQPTCSYRSGCQMPSHLCVQAHRMAGRLTTLSQYKIALVGFGGILYIMKVIQTALDEGYLMGLIR